MAPVAGSALPGDAEARPQAVQQAARRALVGRRPFARELASGDGETETDQPRRPVEVALTCHSVNRTFTGWKGDFQGFFLGLQADNSKAYFTSHRLTYEEEVKGPMVALLSDLEPEFGPARLSRPNRDLRFSADRSPYKLNIYADARGGGYVALDAGGLVAAGGRYVLDAAQLARLREAIAAERSGRELAAIVAGLRDTGYEVGGQELKRVPPPYRRDHPRADLLRHRRLIYWRRWEIGPWIATREALERVAQVWRDGRGLNAWLADHVDGQ